MTPEDADRRLREKIEKALVPADLCATDPEAIEALLDAAKADPFSEDKVSRMLRKLKGELPIGERAEAEEEEPAWSEGELTEEVAPGHVRNLLKRENGVCVRRSYRL